MRQQKQPLCHPRRITFLLNAVQSYHLTPRRFHGSGPKGVAGKQEHIRDSNRAVRTACFAGALESVLRGELRTAGLGVADGADIVKRDFLAWSNLPGGADDHVFLGGEAVCGVCEARVVDTGGVLEDLSVCWFA